MAATTSQGKSFTLFMAGLTVAAAGLAFVATAIGKLALVVGLAVVAVSFAGFFKLKVTEGAISRGAQPALLKLCGLGVVLLGWLIVLFGLHMASGVGGRMATTLIGLAVSLAGVLGILPVAVNKNAIWKA